MMTIRQKLEVIRKMLGITQSELAQQLGVSFPTFNSWWNEKSVPRSKRRMLIDDLFLEVTGQKKISTTVLQATKQDVLHQSKGFPSIIKEILGNKDILDQFVLKLTYHSNSIEGSTLTEPDTAAIIFDNVALSHRSLIEHLEAKNHQTALTYLFDHVLEKKKIDEHLVRKLHSILMNGIISDAGLYRNHAVRIVGVNLPTANYVSVPKRMQELLKEIPVTSKDVITSSAHIHSEFEKIHPFSDGNGRVGRLLMNAMLLRANIAPAVIRQEQKQLYYTYLYKAQTTDDQSQLENFIGHAIRDGFRILKRAE